MNKIRVKNLETIRKEYLEKNPIHMGISGMHKPRTNKKYEHLRFWITDKDMKLIFETKNVYKRGNYTEVVENKRKKYNYTDGKTQTDSTLLNFEFNLFVIIHLKYLAQLWFNGHRLKKNQYQEEPESEWFIRYKKQIYLIKHLLDLDSKKWEDYDCDTYEDYLKEFRGGEHSYKEFLEWQASGYKDNVLFFLDKYLAEKEII